MAVRRAAVAQAAGCGSDLWRVSGKKRLVAESAVEALRAWNDAKEIEKCPREDDWVEMYRHIGDKEALDDIRNKNPNRGHCRWLQRDSNACNCLPDGIDDVEAGTVCLNNVYVTKADIFANRDGVMDTIDRLFRLINSAELGIVSPSELDPLSVSELIAARNELDRQSTERSKRDHEAAAAESLANQERARQERLR